MWTADLPEPLPDQLARRRTWRQYSSSSYPSRDRKRKEAKKARDRAKAGKYIHET